MQKRWESKKISESEAKILANTLHIPYAVAKLLVSIGITEPTLAIKFLKPNLNQLHNPFLLKDMEKAVERINRAIDNGEKILGHGDYDCDGVTTSTLLKEGFRLLGVDIDVFAPNRFKDGYGLNPKRMNVFAREYDLIISGDTGIRAFPAATLVKEIGHADLIVTDHHEPHIVSVDTVDKEAEDAGAVTEIIGDEKIYLPDCYAVIDQQRLGDPYPNKSLAGVGVVFKLMQALFMSRKVDMKPLLYYLDLVATGTIADLAKQVDAHGESLDFENRVMCKYGIEIMNQQPKPWVKAISLSTSIKKISDAEKEQVKSFKQQLKDELKATDWATTEEEEWELEEIKQKTKDFRTEFESKYLHDQPFFKENEKIDSISIGFRIGPTLNAPGRLEDPMPAVDLLLEKDEETALKKAKALKQVNTKRQEQTKEYENVIAVLDESPEEHKDYGIVVQSDKFHIGIAGLVAGKLQQHYYRPAIALAPVEKEGKVVLKGSARSIPGVHILRCLDYVKEKIGPYEYGGHEQAAGLTLEPHRFDAFRTAFREACMNFGEDVLTPCVYYDTEIQLEEANEKLIEFISHFEPFGEGMFISDTKKPLFKSSQVTIKELKEIMDGKGCILTFEQNRTKVKGVTFRGGEEIISSYYKVLKEKGEVVVDILYSPEFNVWNGNRYVQLMLEDVKFDV